MPNPAPPLYSPCMLKAILFAIVFAIGGVVVFSLLAPILFHGADMRRLGQITGPVILLVCGTAGFIFGRRRSKKT